ncbi:hypothetical protein [Saccharopolyspora elongata]|uniref:hypothetical protein n=1 Tax=Saccharopolyspora elongata TaxID=2530387 RepID=UPI0014044158|nr:hypothetical protein [Saccharopolyspora elongata]
MRTGQDAHLTNVDSNRPTSWRTPAARLDAAGEGDEVVAAKDDGGDYDENPVVWRLPGR